MSLSKLKLNPEKTEFIVYGSKAQRQKISSHFPVSILGSLLHLVDSVRNLGVWFDAEFSFSEYVKRTCKACFLQMRNLRRIRQYLTPEVAVLAANALANSCHSAVVPIAPGVVTQIINTLLFLLSAHQSSSQSNILITALPLMLLRSGMNSLMMCAEQHQLPPSERSLKLTCLQKHIPP